MQRLSTTLAWIQKYRAWFFSGFLMAMVVGVVWWQWCWIIYNHEAFRNVGLILFALLGAPFAVWRTMIANKNTDIALQNTSISERNSFVETYSRAIEQLGAGSTEQPNIEIRIGGIYALEKLSDNQDYSMMVTSVLTSYVQLNAVPYTFDEYLADIQDSESSFAKRCYGDSRLRIDVIASLDFLIRIPRHPFRLHSRSLTAYVCLDGKFMDVVMHGCNLRGSVMKKCDFTDASLNFSNLDGVKFEGSIFTKTDLEKANLRNADLRGAKCLTCEQLKSAINWKLAYRDEDLACGADIPEPPPEA